MRNEKNYPNRLQLIVFAYQCGYELTTVLAWEYAFKKVMPENGMVYLITVRWNRYNEFFFMQKILFEIKKKPHRTTVRCCSLRFVKNYFLV